MRVLCVHLCHAKATFGCSELDFTLEYLKYHRDYRDLVARKMDIVQETIAKPDQRFSVS